MGQDVPLSHTHGLSQEQAGIHIYSQERAPQSGVQQQPPEFGMEFSGLQTPNEASAQHRKPCIIEIYPSI